ncbi:MAG: CopG family ribbon-helix-helix protein [Rhizobiaceae bacterium]|nr:CopG family ribbon-helix-helix protein [Rhizobiaceae bacterium]MCV0406626.1 CopG family ribbon-helix-helix protein [Rhizobiaceae bacterium]
MAIATSVKLDDELKDRVRALAETRRRSAHWIMREAIAEYVAREEKRESFRQDTLQAWNDYQATGLHATAEEVEEWLAGWGGDEERPAPECHE